MATFVAPGSLQVPRIVPALSSSESAAAAFNPVLGGHGETSFLTSAGCFAVAAVTFTLFTALRQRRSRVAVKIADRNTTLGPVKGPRSGMCWHEYKFRSKAGSKYKNRCSADRYNSPEFGLMNRDEPDRVIKYGRLLRKGTPALINLKGPAQYDDWFVSDTFGQEAQQGALLLDCDGTLVETERDGHRVAFNKAFKEKGFDFEWDVELYGELLTTGGGKERMTRYFTDINPDAWTEEDPPSPEHPTIVELHKLKTELFTEIVTSGELGLREGIKELISAAVAAGWKLAVCSTSNEASVTAVVKTYLPEFAEQISIYAGDIVSAKKPDPAVYELACKELGMAPMKCIVVEDTAIGLQAGKAAGMKVIVTKSFYSENEEFGDADVIVGNASELDFAKDVCSLIPVLSLA